jgi:hypothetical protein
MRMDGLAPTVRCEGPWERYLDELMQRILAIFYIDDANFAS